MIFFTNKPIAKKSKKSDLLGVTFSRDFKKVGVEFAVQGVSYGQPY